MSTSSSRRGGAALNRVLGSNPSEIYGKLTATGQVFLTNPNGVYFAPGAQVDIGGSWPLTNAGTIRTAPGGTVALIAARIENQGMIEAPEGQVLLGAGCKVKLDLGLLYKLEVEEGALNAMIEQGGAIRADGGLIYLTAQAADALTHAVINHTGISEAKSLATGKNGEIMLMGDMTQGEVHVAGTLDASAPQGGQGGFIETSAARVKVDDNVTVRAGEWLIDPNDFTVAASGGDITGTALSSALASGDVTIATTGATASCTGASCSAVTSGNGDIFVQDNVTWSSGKTLTLHAHRNIRILSTLDASTGSGGKVVLEYGQGSANGTIGGQEATYDFGLTSTGFTGEINLQEGNNFSTKLGSSGTPVNYYVITQLGVEGDATTTTLQGMKNNLAGNYALGADIDSATSGWDGGSGFEPVGKFVFGQSFIGRFDGLGHTVQNLTT